MHRFYLFLAALLCLSVSVSRGAESVVVDSQSRDVLNSGVVSFASGQLQIDHIQVIAGAGGGGTLLSSLTLFTPSVLFASNVAFNVSTSDVTGTLTLANAPANSIFGNPTSLSATPTYITSPTVIQGLAGLGNVENIKLSTWPGSVNITTIGNIAVGTVPFSLLSGAANTAQIANSAVTYAKIQNVTGNRLLGNPISTPGPPVEIPIGSGLAWGSGGTLTATGTGSGSVTSFSSGNASPVFTTNVATSTTTPAQSFTLSNAGPFTVLGNNTVASTTPAYYKPVDRQAGTDANLTINNGKTVFEEGPALTANRTATLPAANAYAPSALLTYTDAVTSSNFGRGFIPGGSDTLNGGTAAVTPFIAGALGSNGSRTAIFRTDGVSAWRIISNGTVDRVQDPGDANRWFTFAASQQVPGSPGIVTGGVGNTVTVAPTDPGIPGVLRNILTDGTVPKSQLTPTELLPQEDLIGVAGSMITDSVHLVVNDGSKDTVRIAGTLTSSYTIKWPDAANYTTGEDVKLIDASGSVSPLNTVTITSTNGTDTFANGLTSFIFDESNGRKVLTSDGSGNWAVTTAKTSIQPFKVLTATTGNTFTIASDTNAVKQNVHLNLLNGANNLRIANAVDGMSYEVVAVQPSSGAQGTLSLPTGSYVSANGLGVVTLSSANGAIDRLRASYDGTLGTFLWEAPILNHTSSALPTAPTALATGGITASKVDLSWTDNASNETGFAVERAPGTSGTSFAQIATTAAVASTGGTGTYSDTGVAAGTGYNYRVRAFNAGGNSSYSATASATTSAGGATADLWEVHFNENTGLTAHATVGPDADLIYADWTTSTQASAAAFAPVVGLSPTGSLAVSNQGTASTGTYKYRVAAFKNNGLRNSSPEVTTTTGSLALSSANFNRITWAAVTGADYYVVYRTSVLTGGSPTGVGSLSGTGSGFTATTFDDTGVGTTGSVPSNISNATDNHIATSHTAITFGTQVMSVSFWAKGAFTTTGTQSLITTTSGSANFRINYLQSSGSKFQITYPGVSGTETATVLNSVTSNGSAVNSGTTWHHIVVTMDNSTAAHQTTLINVYYDGNTSTPPAVTYTATSKSGAFTFPPGSVKIGDNSSTFAIDDVRIYSTILTPTQISNLFTGNAQ